MKKLSISTLLIGVLVAPLLTPPIANAQVPDVPKAVTQWFIDSAPGIVDSQSLPSRGATAGPGDHYLYPFNSKVGKPVPIMVWRDAFLSAKVPTLDMLEPRGDYVAPISAQGRGVGTITAEITNGQWGYRWDDDAQTAAALMAARPKDVIASDGLNGVFIISDNTVRQHGLGRNSTPVAGTLAQLQAAIVAQRADYDQQVAANGGEALSGVSPIDFDQVARGNPVTTSPAAPQPAVVSQRLVLAAVIGGIIVVLVTGWLVVRRGRSRSRLGSLSPETTTPNPPPSSEPGPSSK